MSRLKILAPTLGVVLCAMVVAASSHAGATARVAVRLVATAAPGCTLEARGTTSKAVRPGRYRVSVRDTSRQRYFRLVGRGVNRQTTKSFVGSTTWTVTLARGKYRFECAIEDSAKGTLIVR
jgi:hypothetical protein